jgi:serine/threonine-protein kinase
MYELLTGRPPFTGDSPVAIAYQHVRENPIPPSRLDPDIPPWADAIVLKAMAKPPGERYQSAAEMQADIQRAASGMQVAAMAPPPTRAEYYGDYGEYGDRTQRMGQATMMSGAATARQPYPQRTGGFEPSTYGGGGGYPPDEKSWARRWLPWLIPAVVIIAVIAVAASMLLNHGKTYYVPTVDGLSLQQAETQMQQAGLNYTVNTVASATVPKGTVVSTNPPNGQSVQPNTTVTIDVSGGVGKIPVPNVVGQSQDVATNALEKAGLNVQVQSDPTSTQQSGTVTKEDPPAGTQATPNQTVTIFVSGGGVTVPSVISESYATAQQQLQNLGLNVTVTQGNDPNQPQLPPGDVYQQSINPNTVVPKGTAITIYYQQQPTPSQTPSMTPPPTTPPASQTPTAGPPGGPTPTAAATQTQQGTP